MPDEIVLDASVAAKMFITEQGSDEARALALSGLRMIAPELILIELTNVAVKRMRSGDIGRGMAQEMVAAAAELLHELVSARHLIARAFVLAADHGFSTYDATYVALAELRACDLVTSDLRLASAARRAKLPIILRQP
ncbi:MAG TPA: type II toxin-antitoxin system VapC family toxin [Caulobacteraceae bacterium]|nr:type II toxin-antitoxin system VapC family toxin [Caulobacteraceae bacterium]